MNLQPTLYKENINIRPLVSADYEEMYSAASDPAILAGMPQKIDGKRPFTKWFDFMVDVGSLTIREQDKNWCYTFLHYAQRIGSYGQYILNKRMLGRQLQLEI